MKKSFNTFWEDYYDMCIIPQTAWMKKHWRGYIAMLIGCGVGSYAIGWIAENKDEIGDKVKGIFKKDEEA